MEKKTDTTFLCRRMKELREKNGVSQKEMADKLKVANKSTISRVESGKMQYKNLIEYARDYCKAFEMSEDDLQRFLRGDKIAIPDTSALLKNTQLIDELSKEYSKVIIPDIVIDELTKIKNRSPDALGKKAWEIIRNVSYNERTRQREYIGNDFFGNNDRKIIAMAKDIVSEFGCKVDIITDDTDYSAYLKGDESVTALHLREYMVTKQALVNMASLMNLKDCYADDYSNIKKPAPEEVDAYLPDGYTLIISAVRDHKHTFEQRKEKIKWLISHGADVNKRDHNRRYFPPISHAIQMNDFDMFIFLLKECAANPNVGSRNPLDASKVRQKNEGNMPLMIAAWDGRDQFVKALCEDSRTSINQQDANGFTALIKACYWGFLKCRDILITAGADTKIVDIDGKTAEDHYNDFLETGRQKKRPQGNTRQKNEKGNKW